jgi:hypothetical protein
MQRQATGQPERTVLLCCTNEGCENYNTSIELTVGGGTDLFFCGPCGQQITTIDEGGEDG